MDKVTGYVTGVNGNLVAATFSGSVRKNEVGYVQVGDRVELSGELMSVPILPLTDWATKLEILSRLPR